MVFTLVFAVFPFGYADGSLAEANISKDLQLVVYSYADTYDGEEHKLEATTIDGAKIEYFVDNAWIEKAPTIKDVGEKIYKVKATHPNYETAEAQGTLKVTAKDAKITADDKSKKVGEADPELTAKVTDILTGEEDSFKYKLSREAGEEVGNYDIKIEITKENPNYSFELIKGLFSITKPSSGNNGGGDQGGKDQGGKDQGGGNNGGGGDDYGEYDPTEIEEDETPLGKLNTTDHHAYIFGYPDNTVRPEAYLNRQEVAAIFFRLLEPEYRESIRSNSNEFTDINSSMWSNKHISTLAKGHILEGYIDGSFRPESNITRAELAAIASRFDKLEEFKDHNISDIKGHWAEKFVGSAVKKGWVNGYEDGTFRPDNFITRAEFATFVNNVLNRHVKLEDILDNTKEFDDFKDKTLWYYTDMKVATNSYLFDTAEKVEPGMKEYQKWTQLIYPLIER